MKLLKVSLFSATLAVFSFGAACSSTTPGLEDVVYEGGASDEALDAMLALPSQPSPGPLVFVKPSANAQLPAATPPAFAWTDATAPRAGVVAPRARSGAWRARGLLGGGPAHAHGAALNGKAYLLTFSSSANPKALRVFTTLTTYTPTPTAWQKLSAEKGAITAKLQAATFDNNTVVTGGGPFDGGSITFTVTP